MENSSARRVDSEEDVWCEWPSPPSGSAAVPRPGSPPPWPARQAIPCRRSSCMTEPGRLRAACGEPDTSMSSRGPRAHRPVGEVRRSSAPSRSPTTPSATRNDHRGRRAQAEAREEGGTHPSVDLERLELLRLRVGHRGEGAGRLRVPIEVARSATVVPPRKALDEAPGRAQRAPGGGGGTAVSEQSEDRGGEEERRARRRERGVPEGRGVRCGRQRG